MLLNFDNASTFAGIYKIAVAARGGMETLRPALQRVYMTRASAYRDALKSFIEGYQEGLQQIMEKEDSNSPKKDKIPPKSAWPLSNKSPFLSPESEQPIQVVYILLTVQIVENLFGWSIFFNVQLP